MRVMLSTNENEETQDYILNKMSKKDPRVAKNLKTLERARNDFYDSLDAFDKKYGK